MITFLSFDVLYISSKIIFFTILICFPLYGHNYFLIWKCSTYCRVYKYRDLNSLTHGFEWTARSEILVIDGWGIVCEITLRWLSSDLTDDKQTVVQVMDWCHQATSHYLSQCWPSSLSSYGITGPQWVNWWSVSHYYFIIITVASNEYQDILIHQLLKCLCTSFFRLSTEKSSKLCLLACYAGNWWLVYHTNGHVPC